MRKLVNRFIGSLGFTSMVIGACGMDSEVLVLPIILIITGLLLICLFAILEEEFWNYEEII